MDDQLLTPEDRDEIFEYLNDLRESGAVNMFEAPRLLQQDFGLTSREAREVFFAWTEWFSAQAQDR